MFWSYVFETLGTFATIRRTIVPEHLEKLDTDSLY
jgi:hypothetical protein